MTDTSTHWRFMQAALLLARRQLGRTWPNPSVGAVLVKDGQIIAQAATANGGRPHAETQAIAQAGKKAKGATLYVTLEPCAHHGKTPPCTESIIKAGITKCVIACRDISPQVNGKGIAELKAAGIEVVENIASEEALKINRGFFSVVQKQRPFISLKTATSLDGKITGKERWITGESARNYGHLLRSRYDAILTGIGTVLADDPELTCRLPGLEDRSPVRVVLDREGRMPKQSKLKTNKDVPLWVLSQPTLKEAIAELTKKGITRLLVEAGQELSTAFITENLVDRIYWFRAPIAIGMEGLDALGNGLSYPLPEWKQVKSIPFPPDTLEILEPA